MRQIIEVLRLKYESNLSHERIALHARYGAGRYATLTEHMPKLHRAHAEWSPGRFMNWAIAIGNQACRHGLSVRYLCVPRLFEQLRIAHGDGSNACKISDGHG